MRVLQLIDSLQIGGAESIAVNYANLLTKEIEGVFLCTTREEGPLKKSLHEKVKYLFLKKKSSVDFTAIKTLNKFIKENKITIIHAHATSYFFATLLKFFNWKIKIVWHDHNGNRSSSNLYANSVLKFCSRFFYKAIVVNIDLKLWAENTLYVKDVYYLPNFSVLKEKEEERKTIMEGVEGKRIVCLANLRNPKNHILLLKAFSNISNAFKDWTLHLIGEDFNDEYSENLNKFIQENSLEKRVFLYGLKQDIKQILEQSDIGVLSSTSEGLPLAIIEYGLAKLAVIATDVGDCNKVIRDRKEGVLVASNDESAFSEALSNYINNKTLRVSSGEMLYKNIEDNFSAQNSINQLISIYTKE
ncbi:glycosyltransferase [Flavivirga eckloniae]|uniref:Glycosyltransferase n=1 Tax=Flavivirga eckloniae TaxID=1803846 RepID=A0A2K9PMA5_9FLAO|nr:glycosyltransferase [Flavivirga eckloniae]AUP78165.1 glycosyltransferase [Flavivirga eckloniae]